MTDTIEGIEPSALDLKLEVNRTRDQRKCTLGQNARFSLILLTGTCPATSFYP